MGQRYHLCIFVEAGNHRTDPCQPGPWHGSCITRRLRLELGSSTLAPNVPEMMGTLCQECLTGPTDWRFLNFVFVDEFLILRLTPRKL